MNETQQKKRLKLLRDESQLKRHYKMFKTNKGWLVAAISLLIFSGGVAFNQPVVHAEEATTTSVSESSVTSDASSVSSVKSESTSAASVATTASSTESTAVGSEQSSSAAASSSSASSAVSSVSKETSLATSVTTKIAKSSSTDSVTNSATSLSLSSASSSDATSSNTSSAANTSGNQTSSATSQVASSAVTSGASNSSLRSASSLNSNSNTESASNSASNASTSLSSFASDASQYVNGETLVDPTAEDIANAEAAGSAVYAATGESQSFSTVSAAAVSEAASSSAVASSAAADTVNFWTPGSDVNANANTGTYGGDLKNYVYTGDPFASTVDGTVDIVAKTPVVAKGIYGTVKWYISDGVLHLGAGTPIASNTSKAANPQLPLNLVSPWKQYQSEFTTISIDGKITLKNGNSYLFGSLDQTTAITGAENLDFSSATDITGMFRGTTKLLSISGTGLGTGSWNMSSVTSASSMFLNDSALLTLDVSNWGMNSATSFASMFLGAKSLTTITGIENWTTNSLNNTYAMFDGATSLQSLDLSKWNTSLVTSMAYMFRNNTSLNSLNVSNWNTSKLVNGVDKNGNPSNGIENMFSGASSIKQLDLSSWSTSALTSMTNVFSGMTSLKQITFGSGFVTTNVTGGSVALPNTTSTTKWVNVGSGTTAKPQASTVITAYPGTGADTYVLKTIASATLSSPTVTYNGKNASEAAGLTATVGSKVIPLSSKDVVVTKNSAAVNSTGYKYTLNSTGIQTVLTALGTDYILSSANVTPGKIIIAKAAATGSLTLDSTGKTYDGNEVSVKPTISFTTNDGSPAPSYILQAGDYEVVDNGSAVKDYTVQLTAAGIKNIEANMNYTFDLSNATAKYTISAATGTIQ
ncbi:BspA family leucine-rich repeat surface protein, partial [Pediococcus cellicola]